MSDTDSSKVESKVEATETPSRPTSRRVNKTEGEKANAVESTPPVTQGETPMPQPNKSESKENSGLVVSGAKPQLYFYGNRPIGPDTLEVAETMNSAGIRPIGVSTLHVCGTINSAGIRPIMEDEQQFSSEVVLMGNRPIGLSPIDFSHAMLLSGVRPIASNDLGEVNNLMGYLD